MITYTDPSSPADRPELEVKWGDGTLDTVKRTSITAIVPNKIQKNTYVYTHVYPGASAYKISVEDPNRNAGVLNIPNSVNTTFYIESWLKINPFSQSGGYNNSPQLLNPPIDNACVGKIYIHNPGAYDIDGDSLSYKLVPCLGTNGGAISNYQYPDQIQPGSNNKISLNAITGDFIWNSPQQQGEYNIAILIEEWRNGVNIGSVLRDMQITVGTCFHDPPVIAPISTICVIAGDTLNLLINAVDPDGDNVTLTANGGPLVLPVSPALYTPPAFPGSNVTGQLYWETVCSHIRKQHYQVNFKAQDDGQPNLVDLEAVQIKVIGPPPKNPKAVPKGNAIRLSWDYYSCQNASYIKIYRRKGSSGYTPAYCETGVPASTGYQLIHSTGSSTDTMYLDNNNGAGLIPGEQYCYMLVAQFPDGPESVASVEFCASLKKEVPILTHVSVDSTDVASGRMYIDWSKPTEYDTVAYPGPNFRYLIYRSPDRNGGNFSLLDSTMTINDTIYQDLNLDTKDKEYSYRIDMYHINGGQREFMGSSTIGSSVYIVTVPSDNQITLNWDENVPWANTSYTVYRKNKATLQFDSIGVTTTRSFTDTMLANGVEYCYKVRSKGGYSTSGINYPLLNFSQINCDAPVDNTPPCAPDFTLEPNCLEFYNNLIWNNPNNSCADDVVEYRVYRKASASTDYMLLRTINSALDTSYLHGPLDKVAGCYYVTAVDSFGNESEWSDTLCTDNCPYYELPNVFTPGSDGKNDFFVPFPYRYIESIELEVYNRWGDMVFTTNDPDVNWDGKHRKSGTQVSDGVYFYICTVYEQHFEGIIPRTLKGTVQVLNNQKQGGN